MWDTLFYLSVPGVGISEVNIGLSTPEIGTKKPFNVGVELELKDVLEKDGVVDRVKGTGEIDSYTNGSMYWLFSVQSFGDVVVDSL